MGKVIRVRRRKDGTGHGAKEIGTGRENLF